MAGRMAQDPIVVLQPPSDFDQAETFAAAALTAMGLPTRRTPRGPDGGLDLVGPDLAGQVKHTGRAVGRPAVQQLVGAAGPAARKVMMAASGYTAAATIYADTHGVALFTYDTGGAVRAANATARTLTRRPGTGPSAAAVKRQVRQAADAQDVHIRLQDAYAILKRVIVVIENEQRGFVGPLKRARLDRARRHLKVASKAERKMTTRQARTGADDRRQRALAEKVIAGIHRAAREMKVKH